LTLFFSNFLGFALLNYIGRGAYNQYFVIDFAFSSIGVACMLDLCFPKMTIVGGFGVSDKDRERSMVPEKECSDPLDRF
jgi:hypothetical protein